MEKNKISGRQMIVSATKLTECVAVAVAFAAAAIEIFEYLVAWFIPNDKWHLR